MELKDLMDHATVDVAARPMLVAEALAGGRRRLRRRRARRAAGALAVTVTVLGGVAALPATGRKPATPAHAPLAKSHGDGRTHGDLAGDAAFMQSVQELWFDNERLQDQRDGQAEVIWAGTTPAGPAAVLSQPLRKVTSFSASEALVFVGPREGGGSTIVGAVPYDPANPSVAWWVDRGHTVLAAVTSGTLDRDLGWSRGWSYTDDGAAKRSFTRFTEHDGVGWVVLPHTDANGIWTTAVSRLPWQGGFTQSGVSGVGPYPGVDTRLQWFQNGGFPVFKTGCATPNKRAADRARAEASYPTDKLGYASLFNAALSRRVETGAASEQFSLWYGCGTLSNGRLFLVGEHNVDVERAQLYVVLPAEGSYREQVIREGVTDATQALPVRITLPDGSRFVAAKGAALQWRHAQGPWSHAVQNADHVPAAATEVRVSSPGARLTVVPLS